MYINGDFVLYGAHGVCRVAGIEKQLVNRKRTEYLVLEPVSNQESKFLVPTQNPVALSKVHPVLTQQELQTLLMSDEIRTTSALQDENYRKQQYRDLISSGDRVSILRMIHSLYRYREEQAASGRKFHQCDENFLRDAERLVSSEIALVMEMTAEEARNYLRVQLK